MFQVWRGKYLTTWQKLRIIRAEDNWRQTLKGSMCQAGDLATFTGGIWTWSMFYLLTLDVYSVIKFAFQLNWKLKLKKSHLHVDDSWVSEGQEPPSMWGASEWRTWLGHREAFEVCDADRNPKFLIIVKKAKTKTTTLKTEPWAELALEHHNPSSQQWFQLQDCQVAFRKCINAHAGPCREKSSDVLEEEGRGRRPKKNALQSCILK